MAMRMEMLWEGLDLEIDYEAGSKLEAERVTLEFATASHVRLDCGTLPIEESPLFGGRKQMGLFGEGE